MTIEHDALREFSLEMIKGDCQGFPFKLRNLGRPGIMFNLTSQEYQDMDSSALRLFYLDHIHKGLVNCLENLKISIRILSNLEDLEPPNRHDRERMTKVIALIEKEVLR